MNRQPQTNPTQKKEKELVKLMEQRVKVKKRNPMANAIERKIISARILGWSCVLCSVIDY
jgi:hypothetical protein